MQTRVMKEKPTIAERLLALRSRAGDDLDRHRHYHRLVGRYQKWLLRRYRPVRQAV